MRSAAAWCRVATNHRPPIGHPQLISLPIGTRSPCLQFGSCRAMRPVRFSSRPDGHVDSSEVSDPHATNARPPARYENAGVHKLCAGNNDGNPRKAIRVVHRSKFRAGRRSPVDRDALLHRYTVVLARQWLAVDLSCTFCIRWGVASKNVHGDDGGCVPRNDRLNDIRTTPGSSNSGCALTALNKRGVLVGD